MRHLRLDRIRQSRPILLVLTAIFAGVPTAFTIFAKELGGIPLWMRVGVAVVWVVTVLVASLSTLLKEEEAGEALDLLRRITVDGADAEGADAVLEGWSPEWDAYEEVVGETLIEDLLHRRWSGLPKNYELTVFLHDEDADRLVPTYPRSTRHITVKSFRPGQGAVGQAWAEKVDILATGDQVSNQAYDLSGPQQHFFRPYRSVIATPLLINGNPVGSIGAISLDEDGYFENADNRKRLRALSVAIGIVLDGMSPGADNSQRDAKEAPMEDVPQETPAKQRLQEIGSALSRVGNRGITTIRANYRRLTSRRR